MVRVNVVQVNISSLNVLLDEMIMHFNMLSAHVKHRVLSQMNTTHVVAVKENLIRDGFTCGDDRAPLFGFCARQCHCRLLLVAPGDSSTVEGEDEP